MKKIMLCVMALVCAFTVSAQTAEEIEASAARMAKLAELQMPKSTGLAQVDALQEKAGRIASESLRISASLSDLKKSMENGGDVVAMLATAISLGQEIAAQGTAAADAALLLPKAAEELKTIKNPMKLKAPKASLDYSRKVLETVGEETPYQAQVIAAIIQSLKKE